MTSPTRTRTGAAHLGGPGILRVSECYGPVHQGEGPHTGKVVGFLRLGLCNLACSYCDSAFTWDAARYDLEAEAPPVPVDVVARRVAALGVSTVVISGGEPLMHQHVLPQLMDALPGVAWHVETNGTIVPSPAMLIRVEHWSVSPKLANNGADPERKRIKPRALQVLRDNAPSVFKFVVTDASDVAEVVGLADQLELPRSRVWVMPEGTTATSVVATHRAIAPAALAAGLATTTRLHVLLHDDARGV